MSLRSLSFGHGARQAEDGGLSACIRTEVPPHNELSLAVAFVEQGWFVALPILFSDVGLVLVAVGGVSCDMFALYVDGALSKRFGYTGVERWEDGTGTCDFYTDPPPALQAGYICVILATLLGGLAGLGPIFTAFVRFPPWALVGMSVSAFVVAALGAVVCCVAFAAAECQADGSACVPASMMYVAMVGTLSWIASGTALLFVTRHEQEGIPIPRRGAADAAVAPHVETETCVGEIVDPDGATTRATATVASDEGGQKHVDCVTEPV
jgi:hypothetical protein